ncbi:rhomboid family intramembrane serine protease [Paludisphaera rhizosphaerae]|uniref:rhomboid family intramembrane serine protease n=1 Tax=Paludisphaera rhizosphaerae TaxID=2711216 RepID=UPI0013EA44D7|nr:rhomboid family intramembrane serine protease [Paludisphaera rhizosphaerae]
MVLPLGDLQPTRIVPVVTYALIALNVVMFFVQSQRGDQFTMALACTPWEITHAEDIDQPILRQGAQVRHGGPFGDQVQVDPREVIPHAPSPIPVWLTMFTAMFLHGSLMHLLGNMLYLWIVGDNVEEVLGGVRYFIVYLACGLMGSLAQIAAAPNSTIPTLGASGAIAGIMGAYVVWFPHNHIRVLVFRFITVLPAVIVIGGWIVLQIWLGVQGFGKMGETGGVAYLAHVGGAVTGIVVALLFYNRAQQVKAMDAYAQGWRPEPPSPYGYS